MEVCHKTKMSARKSLDVYKKWDHGNGVEKDLSLEAGGEFMKIITWNVNGIRAGSKKGLIEFAEREDADILCLQETKAHPDQLEPNLIHLGGRESYWSSAVRKGYSGTVTYLKEKPIDVQQGIGIRKFDIEGRFVVTEHPDFVLYNVYFPNGAAREERHLYKQEFLKKFTAHLKKKMDSDKEVVVLGDYNVAPRDIDVYDPKSLCQTSGFLPEEQAWFGSFLETGFVDLFRHFHPDEPHRYSWWSYKENARIANRGWRIDHICCTRGLLGRVQFVDILDEQMGSDHCPVVLEMKEKAGSHLR